MNGEEKTEAEKNVEGGGDSVLGQRLRGRAAKGEKNKGQAKGKRDHWGE